MSTSKEKAIAIDRQYLEASRDTVVTIFENDIELAVVHAHPPCQTFAQRHRGKSMLGPILAQLEHEKETLAALCGEFGRTLPPASPPHPQVWVDEAEAMGL